MKTNVDRSDCVCAITSLKEKLKAARIAHLHALIANEEAQHFLFDGLIDQVPSPLFDHCYASSSERQLQMTFSNAQVIALQKSILDLVEQVNDRV